MKHPRWCLKFITPAEIHAVVQAVNHAEAHTTGEIVPMIVRRSSPLGHLGFQIYCALGFLFVAGHLIVERVVYSDNMIWILMGILVLLWPVSEWLSRFSGLQRLFTLPKERESQVHERAVLEFYSSGFQKTKSHTGVLILLSLMEKKCVVLADEGIAAKLPQETWQTVVDKIIVGIKSGKPAEGLIAAIQTCGEILAAEFPASGKHENQLSNQLIIKE